MVKRNFDVVVNDEPKEVKYLYRIDNEIVTESEFLTRLEEESMNCAENSYDDMLDDCYGLINVCGYEYYASKLLEDTDPVAYRCGLVDYASSLQSDYEYELESNDTVVINDITFEKSEAVYLKGVLINVKDSKIEIVNIIPCLDEYYRLINCDTIDIATRFINGKLFDFIVDDEGLLKDEVYISAVDKSYEPMLAGNLLIVNGCDDDGELVSLTDNDIEHILDNIGSVLTEDMKSYYIVHNCTYN